jgi:hypothetical protein
VVTTVVFLFVSLFVFGVAAGFPQVIDCRYTGGPPAVSVEIESNRKHGYFRTYRALGCTAYFHASNKDMYFH